jgi:hypothetical protein
VQAASQLGAVLEYYNQNGSGKSEGSRGRGSMPKRGLLREIAGAGGGRTMQRAGWKG